MDKDREYLKPSPHCLGKYVNGPLRCLKGLLPTVDGLEERLCTY